MDEVDEILALLKKKHPGSPVPSPETVQRLRTLAGWCPVYRNTLRLHPQLIPWLEDPHAARLFNRMGDYSLMRTHPLFISPGPEPEQRSRSLRLFRRAMSLRIAYRELAGLSDILRSMRELTALAEYVLADALDIVMPRELERMGQPWDEENDVPARFCVLALGKMGSGELNFVSDLDLIYVHDGNGYCRKGGRPTSMPNEQFFARVARELTSLLQERTQEGFLYNIDLRLRPDGDSGPITRSLTGVENYYYGSGQTWERMALMKARPVAGDNNLGGETMETLSAFRFPRTPPPSLFEEVASLKLRIEHEVLGLENFKLNIKNGWGGIREIEFIVQTLQMVYQGRYPFLQTTSTLTAMDGLERYDVLGADDVKFLRESYLWLRRVEHRLQMREEDRTQTLPLPGPAREALAQSLDMSPEQFEAKMEHLRAQVREMYMSYFPMSSRESLVLEWTEFIAGSPPGPQIESLLSNVFWGPREPVEAGIRRLALGSSPTHILTRETAQLMIELGSAFPEALAPQAHPLRTLRRVNEYADRYGARKSFLRLCAHNMPFFHALCMLFDRSSFIHSLVCAHPEILEELMMTSALRLNKTGRVMRGEIRALEQADDDKTARALWLWIKAEQVRIAMAQVLSKVNLARVEFALSRLASVTVNEMLRRVDPEGELIVVAMGKFGAREMSFGSDLDMMLVCRDASTETMQRKALRLQRLLGYKGPLGAGFEVDMRLRPYGKDGPVVVTLPALRHYHDGHGAQLWEKQALLRSRPISDRSDSRTRREDTGAAFEALRREILFARPPQSDLSAEVARMRARIQTEKAKMRPPERCFKAGPGGILDVEFLVQAMQMKHGGTRPEICSPNTREGLKALCAAGMLDEAATASLAAGYEFLRTVEFRLRREHNSPVTCISEDPDLEHSIARWMSFPDFETLMLEIKARMGENRRLFNALIESVPA